MTDDIGLERHLPCLRRGKTIRFVSDISRRIHAKAGARALGSDGRSREPFCGILGGSDSRVTVEIVFDQRWGTCLSFRVAGNIVAPSLIGSVDLPLAVRHAVVVVLGHSRCGSNRTTRAAAASVENQFPFNCIPLSISLTRHFGACWQTDRGHDHDALVHEACPRHNIQASVNQLRWIRYYREYESNNAGVMVVGAEYLAETGVDGFLRGI